MKKLNGYQIVSEFTLKDIGILSAVGGGIGATNNAIHYKRILNKLQNKYEKETDPVLKNKLKVKIDKMIKNGRGRYALKGAGIGAATGAAVLPAVALGSKLRGNSIE